MTFLPIVDRELRLASRKAWTFWLRVTAAGVALFIASGFMLIALAEAVGTAQLGGPLFATLSWLSLACALTVGLFFTSDCLSEEKREGTLGFLFLTDLRGYDVVLGKLLATSLRCVFALVAVFPILAIAQLMGGVEPREFWESVLALIHAMFFSLACGMFVSTVSRSGQKALIGTLLLMMVFLAGGPTLDWALAELGTGRFKPLFSLSSPGFVFVSAGRGMNLFWNALLPSQAVAWVMLASSCWLIQRTWQEKSTKSSAARMRWRYWWKYGGLKRRAAYRAKMLVVNPIVWLASRERWQRIPAWIVLGAVAVGYVLLFKEAYSPALWFVWGFLDSAVSMLFYLWIASQAAQFFAEARRSGVIELLLATPLSSRELVQGPWRALVRMFAFPVGLYVVMGILVPIISVFANWDQTWDAMLGGNTGRVPLWLSLSGRAALAGVTTVGNLIALSWFGMWMGLASRSALFATFKTLLFVQVIPSFVIWFATALLTPLLIIPAINSSGAASTSWFMLWFPLIKEAAWMMLALAKDAIFFFWARKKLGVDFRELAVQAVAPIRVPTVATAMPPMMMAAPPPPVQPAPPVMSKP